MKDKYNKDLLNLLDREVRKVEVENKIRAKAESKSDKSIVKPPKSRSSNLNRLSTDDSEVLTASVHSLPRD